jgi:hypothetical protein
MATTLQPGKISVIRRSVTIHGRTWAVEVLSVDRDRWRARLATRGTANAVMPFYGQTPEEACDRLTAWLTRVAHSPARG